MAYKFGPSLIARETAKIGTAWAAVIGCMVAAVVLVLFVMYLGPRWIRLSALLVITAGAIAVYAGRVGNWAMDTQKSIFWMTHNEIGVTPQGLQAGGKLHAWDTLRVEADGGPDLLVFEALNLKIPVDSLELAESFRSEAKEASRGQLLL